MRTKKQKKLHTQGIKDIYLSFVSKIDAIELFYTRFFSKTKYDDQQLAAEFSKYLLTNFKNLFNPSDYSDLKDGKNKSFSGKQKEEYKQLQRLMQRVPPINYTEILSRGAFIMLNNNFEFLFSDILNYYFRKYPDFLKKESFEMTIDDLKIYNTVNDLYESVVSKKVEKLLFELSLLKLKQFFQDKLNIVFEEQLINWNKIYEIKERRNILIHNNALVNNKYIVTTENPFKLLLNSEVKIDPAYFESSCREIRLAGTIIIFNCWKKWDKINYHLLIEELKILLLDKLKVNDNLFVVKIGEYIDKNIVPQNENDEKTILWLKFNRCVALKRLGLNSEANEIIKSINVDSLSPIFKVAKYVINEEYVKVIDNILNAKKIDNLTIDKYEHWSLFEGIRNRENYNKRIRKILS